MIDSLTFNGIKLIKPIETNSKDLAEQGQNIKSLREELRIMAPSQYSTFHNKDDSLSLKFEDIKKKHNKNRKITQI